MRFLHSGLPDSGLPGGRAVAAWLRALMMLSLLACGAFASPVAASGSAAAGNGPAAAAQGQAAPTAPAEALERLFTSPAIQAEWFAPAFLQQVSVDQVEAIVRQLKAGLGAYESVQVPSAGRTGPFEVVFAKGLVPAQITLDSQGRITGLFFGPPQPRVSGLQQALDGFKALPGEVSVLVTRDGQPLASLNPDRRLAVGSAFKLAVLAALQQEINSGRRHWEDVVRLEPQWKSLPSGILQDWPDGSPLTLYTLAALMISVSDNTAADALIHILGRPQVEKFGGQNQPFLTTREAFVLKDPANSSLLEEYRRADTAGRRALLAKLEDRPLPPVAALSAGPMALDVEWTFSARELADLMSQVQDLALLGINPGVARPEAWKRVAFKGGSEPGVLNLTTWLVSPRGSSYCVVATWNDGKPLDEQRFFGLYTALLGQLENAGE